MKIIINNYLLLMEKNTQMHKLPGFSYNIIYAYSLGPQMVCDYVSHSTSPLSIPRRCPPCCAGGMHC